MSDIKLACDVVEQVKTICDKHGNNAGELINILHEAQHLHGYLPEEMQRIIASKLRIPVSKVYGVVTFYTFFTMTPKGKHPISVCMGTACYVRGSEKLLEEFKRVLGIEVGETTPDGKYSLDCLRCVGACGLAPVVMIGEKGVRTTATGGCKEDYRGTGIKSPPPFKRGCDVSGIRYVTHLLWGHIPIHINRSPGKIPHRNAVKYQINRLSSVFSQNPRCRAESVPALVLP